MSDPKAPSAPSRGTRRVVAHLPINWLASIQVLCGCGQLPIKWSSLPGQRQQRPTLPISAVGRGLLVVGFFIEHTGRVGRSQRLHPFTASFGTTDVLDGPPIKPRPTLFTGTSMRSKGLTVDSMSIALSTSNS